MRQNHLAIEHAWPTKDCWVKLLLACEGMSVVNQQRLNSCAHPGLERKDMRAKEFAATTSFGLKERDGAMPVEPVAGELPLKRVADAMGNTAKQVTPKQKEAKRHKGGSRQRTCFMCRKCQQKRVHCSGLCPHCNTPLCLKAHDGRDQDCHHEHLHSNDPNLRCDRATERKRMPKESREW